MKTPNQIVSKAYADYTKALDTGGDEYYSAIESIKETILEQLIHSKSSLSNLSKLNLLKLCSLQSSLNIIAHHAFLMRLGIVCGDLVQRLKDKKKSI